MKRRMLALLLAVLTLTMLTAAAFAEDTEVLGVYNVTGPLTVTNGTKDGGFYAGADTFELNCTGLTGEYSLVLLLAGDSAVPTEGNIQYIDQTSVEAGKVTFTLKPKALTEGTYNVYISTTDKALYIQRLHQHDRQGAQEGRIVQIRREAGIHVGRCEWGWKSFCIRCFYDFAAYCRPYRSYRSRGSRCE